MYEEAGRNLWGVILPSFNNSNFPEAPSLSGKFPEKMYLLGPDANPMTKYPVLDLHCDLLYYLIKVPGASIMNSEEIGASVPRLKEGGVATQVLAMFAPTQAGSTEKGVAQLEQFLRITADDQPFRAVKQASDLDPGEKINVMLSIESASGFCEEFGDLRTGLKFLSTIIHKAGPLAYISFTHHPENRFGGGNYSDNVGLKPDGEGLLDFLHNKRIPVDIAHASDQLATDIFTYIDKHNLNIPVIASHSNFRPICDHVRNLPDELALEVLRRGGLIGINFLRAYIHDTQPEILGKQVEYGWNLPGGKQGLALGADFFSAVGFPYPERLPLFFAEHEHAGTYPALLDEWAASIADFAPERLAFENATEFFKNTLFSTPD